MDENQIGPLANAYKGALLDEFKSKIAAAEAQQILDDYKTAILAEAMANGVIDGKNADTRKRQAADVLANAPGCYDRASQVKLAEENAGHATIGRQYYDALIGLTKAWLYSQSGR